MPTANPPMVKDIITGALFPQPIVEELFLLRREGVSFEIKSASYGKLKGSGSFFLTNMRLVLYSESKASPKEFMAYQFFLSEIAEPNFKQPVFGANYLEGKSAPPGDTWRITFNSGGAGTFLRVLNDLLCQVARNFQSRNLVNSAAPMPTSYTPASCNIGYIDPSDPSIVYIQQPVPASAPPLE
jgi:hypothetical protein